VTAATPSHKTAELTGLLPWSRVIGGTGVAVVVVAKRSAHGIRDLLAPPADGRRCSPIHLDESRGPPVLVGVMPIVMPADGG
jgi:hypothetical protein